MAMPQAGKLSSHATYNSAGREGAKSTNTPGINPGYGGTMSDALTVQSKGGSSKSGSMGGTSAAYPKGQGSMKMPKSPGLTDLGSATSQKNRSAGKGSMKY